jgi:hypothetical protein
LKEIYKAVDEYIATRSKRNLVEVIIDKAEELGMLPPDTVTTTYTNEWEPEDER